MERERKLTETGKRYLSYHHRRVVEDSRGENISLCVCTVGRKYLNPVYSLGTCDWYLGY